MIRKHRHRHRRRRITPRDGHRSALDRLEAGLQTQDEAAWYAERLERLGRLLFGDLWDANPRESAQRKSEVV